MEVTLTLKRLYEAHQALTRLGKDGGMAHAPAFWIASTLRKIHPDFTDFSERRDSLYEKYGIRKTSKDDERREYWEIPPQNEAAHARELQALLDLEVTFQVSQRPISFLGEVVKPGIEAAILSRIPFMFGRPASDAKETETLTRLQVAEMLAAVGAMATYKTPEAASWWLCDLIDQAEAIGAERAWIVRNLWLACDIKDGRRVPSSEYTLAVSSINKEAVSIRYSPISLGEFGEASKKWPPAMIFPVIFAVSDPEGAGGGGPG